MNVEIIRKKYLDFFIARKHEVIPSASLIPEHDPTTLFTGSGMQPMIPYLMGKKHPKGSRIVDVQKCFRAQDINDVGDNRHTTFFEMIGNWSLGDYFKKDQVEWMYDFITKELDLDPSRIFITCFGGNKEININKDIESADLWNKNFKKDGIDARIIDNVEKLGMRNGRIFYYNETKNWWSRSGAPQNMPVGEIGGTNSEMFWDFGKEHGIHESSKYKNNYCHPNCDCGRFIEIGNNVFMQYKKTNNGFEPLPKNNVDFGGGLERLAAATIDDPDIFMIDIFNKVKDSLSKLSGKIYGEDKSDINSFRVIMDHMRAATFLIGDNALPSNKDQGYYTRRLIRRAVRHANNIGIQNNICSNIIGLYIDEYQNIYPSLKNKCKSILKEVCDEEMKFRKTLEKGLKEFEKIISNKKINLITGEEVFKLYDTFGFPMEITNELAEEKGYRIDKDGFCNAFADHQEKSRKSAHKKFRGGLADCSKDTIKYHTATHLLQEALRRVLGDHINQKGSNITPERLRFDFYHSGKMTSEELIEVENIVNEIIANDYLIVVKKMSLEKAKKSGALFIEGEGYPDEVNVYSVNNFSNEICGGPHVKKTGELGNFKIIKEESSGANIRRIKAILK